MRHRPLACLTEIGRSESIGEIVHLLRELFECRHERADRVCNRLADPGDLLPDIVHGEGVDRAFDSRRELRDALLQRACVDGIQLGAELADSGTDRIGRREPFEVANARFDRVERIEEVLAHPPQRDLAHQIDHYVEQFVDRVEQRLSAETLGKSFEIFLDAPEQLVEPFGGQGIDLGGKGAERSEQFTLEIKGQRRRGLGEWPQPCPQIRRKAIEIQAFQVGRETGGRARQRVVHQQPEVTASLSPDGPARGARRSAIAASHRTRRHIPP